MRSSAKHCLLDRSDKKESGQAMAEFVVIVASVFMVMFIVVPQFGKLMDMSYKTQMASRYIAWERTVWFDSGDEPAETEDSDVAIRNDSLVENTAENRFFYGLGTWEIKEISSSDASGPNGDTSPLWVYNQSRDTMFENVGIGNSASSGGSPFQNPGRPWSNGSNGELTNMPTESIAYEALDVFNDGMAYVAEPISDMLTIEGDGFLQINHVTNGEFRGYYRPGIVTRLDQGNAADSGHINLRNAGDRAPSIERWIYDNWDGEFKYQSAILADGWNAASDDHFEKRTNDLVPSVVFDNALINAVKDALGTLEPNLNNLEFGNVETNPIPDADVDCFMGFCQFDE